MSHSKGQRAMGLRRGLFGAFCATTMALGCQSEVSSPERAGGAETKLSGADELRVTTQQLGEGSSPLFTSGTGLEPSYRARLATFMYNRVRMSPHLYGLRYESPPMSGMFLPFYPAPPARLDTFMTEPGRWMAEYQAETGCDCSAATLGYDPQTNTPPELAPFVDATCCELDVVDGVALCVSPLVPCNNPRATLVGERRAKLNLGISQITNEGSARFNSPLSFKVDGCSRGSSRS